MKLFGSKDNDQTANDGLEDDGFDVSFDTDDTGGLDLDAADGGNGDALSAPTRDFDGGKKSRKGLLLGLLLVLVAGGGAGGYYYLNMMNADAPLGAPKAAKMLPPKNAAPAPTVIGADVPPMPQPEVDTTIAQPDIGVETPDPFAAMDAAPAADTAASAIDMPGFDTPVADANTAAGADLGMPDDPFAAMGAADPAAAADAGMNDVMADLGMPPAAEDAAAVVPADDFVVVDAPVEVEGEAPAVAADAPPVDIPADIPGDLPAATATADTATEAAPAEATPGFAEMAERTAATPAGDLPMPTVTDVMAATDEAATPPVMPEKTPVAEDAAAATPPSDAEKAIVENSAMLDQLSAPAPATAADPAAAGKTAQEILGESAIVRRLPDTYIVVRKDHASGDMDTRLKVARIALMEGRYAAAGQLFDALQADYPRDERVLMGRGLALQQAGRADEALVAYEDVLSANPKNLEALTNMLGILKSTNPALAVEKLEELRTVYPYNADIAAQLGTAYAGLKNYPAAMQYLDMADALEPGNAYVYYNKAVLYDHMGQQNMATAMYRRILQMYAEGRLQEPLPLEAIRRRLASMK